MGPIPQHKGRAEFATGFFGVGGFEVVSNDGFATPEEATNAARAAGAAIVVICSTDATYPELVPPLTKLLKTANPTVNVVLAGYPPDQIEAHRAAGVDEFIHIRSDVYATLQQLLQKTGVLA
jgi:methylmalonyl-CoA mutase